MRVDVSRLLAIAAVIVLLVPLAVIVLAGGQETHALWKEKGPVEIISALGYLAGAGCGFVGALRSRGWLRAQFIVWVVLCLFFFGEETSYLQHYLGYGTPQALAQENAQGEFNIHNLRSLQGGSLLQRDQPLWRALFKSQNLFQLGFALYFLLLPLGVSILGPLRRLAGRINLLIVGWNFLLMGWVPIIVAILLGLASSGRTRSGLAETREMFYSVAIAVFLVRSAFSSAPALRGRPAT